MPPELQVSLAKVIPTGYMSYAHKTVALLLHAEEVAGKTVRVDQIVSPCLLVGFELTMIGAQHPTFRTPKSLKNKPEGGAYAQSWKDHHKAAIKNAVTETFRPMISNVLMQAQQRVSGHKKNPSYQLNTSERIFITALAIYKGCSGNVRYKYRNSAAYHCLRELVGECTTLLRTETLDLAALRRTVKTAELVVNPASPHN